MNPAKWLRDRAESYGRDASAVRAFPATSTGALPLEVTIYEAIRDELRKAADAFDDEDHYRSCHLCGKIKASATAERADYLLAFHYDRRHPGWTKEVDRDASAKAPQSTDDSVPIDSAPAGHNKAVPLGPYWPETDG